MTGTSITPEEFAARCQADNYFATQAVAAALSNEETAAVFNGLIYESSAENLSGSGGLQINSYYSFTYKPPAVQPMSATKPANLNTMAVSPIPGQFTMLAYNGEFTGFMYAAAKIVAKLPLGIVITALTQALFGTKAGPALLLLLLAI